MEKKETPEQKWQSFKSKAFLDQNDPEVKEFDDLVQRGFRESLTELEKWERLTYVIAIIYKIADIKE